MFTYTVAPYKVRGAVHSHNTRQSQELCLPAARLAGSSNGPGSMSVRVYIGLPNDIKEITNLNTFKSMLFNYLVPKVHYSAD